MLISALLVAEISARVWTWWAWSAPLSRHPELAERIEMARTSQAKLLEIRHLFEPPGSVPVPVHAAGSDAPPTWSTFAKLTPEAFPRPPKNDEAAPGVVRIAFVGDSVTHEGYPELVGKLADERHGAGKVEVLNLGVPSATARTTLFVMEKFLPRWRPHVVVLYTGRNDLFLTSAWARATVAEAKGRSNDPGLVFALPAGSRGLLDLLSARDGMFDAPKTARWIEETVVAEPLAHYWLMSRLAWKLDFELVVSTYSAPSFESLSEADADFYDTEIRYLWPTLGGVEQYRRQLAAYNDRVRTFAKRTDAGLVDVAQKVRGGRADFRDICHHTDAARARHADAAYDVIASRVDTLLNSGAPAPEARPAPAAYEPIASVSDPPPPTHPRDGSCVRGPCPEGACFVPAGPAKYGYPEASVDAVFRDAQQRFGFAHRYTWFGDEGPQNDVSLSAFCIDETEVTRARHAACVRDGACAPMSYPEGDLAKLPAIVPTWSDAAELCAHLGGRVPTDAEWDAAARGPEGRRLPWGDTWTGKEANFCGRGCPWALASDPDDGFEGVAPVGSFESASVYGAKDMSGNVWEWVADCFHDQVHRFMPADARDPIYRGEGECRRVIRGGSYGSLGSFLERRTPAGLPDTDVPMRGVRCAYDLGTKHQAIRERPVE